MSNTYCYLHLSGAGRDQTALKQVLTEQVLGGWRQRSIVVWGVWEGLFGVASNELIVMAAAPGQRSAEDFTSVLPASVEVVDALPLRPTARPQGSAPCDTPGLYVFRFFRVRDRDVDEVVALSTAAWETFEASADYASEPKGLFRQQEAATGFGRMLLVTWYDGLDSWQTSRRPAPEATENFQRRRMLTDGTVALATRLLSPFPG